MRLPALKHLVEAVASLSRSERICVLGSSSLLGSFPDLGEAGGPLELTFDADLLVQPCDEQLAAMLHEAVGEGSLFAQRTGYHADILRPEIQETLPKGWPDRLVPLVPQCNAVALHPTDLLVVKLRVGRPKDLRLCASKVRGGFRVVQVGRPKDLRLCASVVRKQFVTTAQLRARLDQTSLPENEIVAVYRRLSELTG